MSNDRLVLQGRFRLIRHLGGGGMAEVYLAEQLSLGRLVALKVLKRDLSSQPAMSERFRREARLLSTVDHPAVVRVIDFETDRRDGTVLVLELAEGETLEQRLTEGPFEPTRAVRLLKQLAEGLAAVHARGIIHRDLKPQNIVIGLRGVTEHGSTSEQARLLDFGIARLMELDHDDGPKLPDVSDAADPFASLPGQAVGTPAYVAPEQATAEPVDTRTDVYAFGVVAFRMLAGRLPFEGPETRDFLDQHVNTVPPPLEVIAPQVAVVPGLAKLVMQCLEKEPAKRPRDGAALAERLSALTPASAVPLTTQTKRVLDAMTTQTLTAVRGRAQSVSQRGLEVWSAGQRYARELPSSVWRSAAITAALGALALLTFWLWPQGPAGRVEAELRAGHAEVALTLATHAASAVPHEAPELLALEAAALFTLRRDEQARAAIRARPYQTLFPANPLLLEALAARFGADEGDAELRGWLQLVPLSAAEETWKRVAQGPRSEAQWGALRLADLEHGGLGLPLSTLYARALRDSRCATRMVAAQRLGALGDSSVVPALRELSESPKHDGADCGQDAAAEAIRTLKAGAPNKPS